MLVARLRRLCDKLFIASIFIKFQSPPNIYKRSVSNIDTNIGLGYTTAIYYTRYIAYLTIIQGGHTKTFLFSHYYLYIFGCINKRVALDYAGNST